MKLAAKFLCAAVTFCLAVTMCAGEAALKMPEGSKIVAQVNLNKVRNQNIYKTIKEKHIGKYYMLQGIVQGFSGIDIEKVQTITLGVAGEDKGVAVATGTFDVEKIKAIVSSNDKAQVQEIPGCLFAAQMPDDKRPGKMNMGVILDQNTIAIGNPEFTKKFIESFNGKAPALNKEDAKIVKNAVSGGNLMDAVLLSMPEKVKKENQILASVKHAYFSVNMDKDLKFTLSMTAINEKKADAMEKVAKALLALKELSNGKTPTADEDKLKSDFLKNILIEKKDCDILVSTFVSTEDLEKVIKTKLEEVKQKKDKTCRKDKKRKCYDGKKRHCNN